MAMMEDNSKISFSDMLVTCLLEHEKKFSMLIGRLESVLVELEELKEKKKYESIKNS